MVKSAPANTYGSDIIRGGKIYTPDLRGIFLRGKNNRKDSGHRNPSGDFALGSQQADGLRFHTHEFNRAQGTPGGDPLRFVALGIDWTPNTGLERGITNFMIVNVDGNSVTVSHDGADACNETRPVNATVNYFIRIN